MNFSLNQIWVKPSFRRAAAAENEWVWLHDGEEHYTKVEELRKACAGWFTNIIFDNHWPLKDLTEKNLATVLLSVVLAEYWQLVWLKKVSRELQFSPFVMKFCAGSQDPMTKICEQTGTTLFIVVPRYVHLAALFNQVCLGGPLTVEAVTTMLEASAEIDSMDLSIFNSVSSFRASVGNAQREEYVREHKRYTHPMASAILAPSLAN